MVSEKDIQHLRSRMEYVRVQLLAGTLEDQKLWLLLQDTSTLLDLSRGGRFEQSLEVIYDLLFTVWKTYHNKLRLARIKEQLEDMN